MTTSENEHEASAAMKMANTILIQEGLTWARVLDRSVKIIQEVEAAPEDYSEPTYKHSDVHHHAHAYAATPTRAAQAAPTEYDNSEIEEAITIIERTANLKGDFENTIDSIIAQYRQGKRLSFKQRELLFKVARR